MILTAIYPSLAQKRKILFYIPNDESQLMLSLSISDLLLVPFPAHSYWSCFHALSLGIPAVTFPAVQLSGKLCEALYSTIDYESSDLVVRSEADYLAAALALSHSRKKLKRHSNEIFRRRQLLFDPANAIEDWVAFFESTEVKSMIGV